MRGRLEDLKPGVAVRGIVAGEAVTVVQTDWFDADGTEFRLAAEARRIQLAYLFDPRLAVHLSVLEPLPHQTQAVYGVMLPRHPLPARTTQAGLVRRPDTLDG